MSVSRTKTAAIAAVLTAGLVLPMSTTVAASAAEPTVGTAIAARMTIKPIITPGMTRQQIRHARRVARHKNAVKIRAQLVRFAMSRLQRGQYVAGASSAWAFDCSGFTKEIYKVAAHRDLPHFSGAQMAMTTPVSKKNLLPGDLLFFGQGGSSHVSMYIGRGRMIGASNPGVDVNINSINDGWYAPRYAGAGRVIKG